MYKIYASRNIVLEDTIISGGVLVNKIGKIQDILSEEKLLTFENLDKFQIVDVNPGFLMCGLVDSHVHINEPGRTEWEGFETATKAAAAGGFTTIVDMPLNSIPATTSVKNLEIKKAAAVDKIYVDVAFWGGIVPRNQDELIPLVNAGVRAFKCFMCPSGVDEFEHVNMKEVEKAMQVLKNTEAVLAFHAEVDCCNNDTDLQVDTTKYTTFLDTRPEEMEINAIKSVIFLTETYGVKTHIVHLSSAKALGLIEEAKARNLPLTVETCHHYLNISSEDIPDKATQYKCCPPIRDTRNKNLLWKGLKDGIIDMVVSDHSPSTPDLKLLNPNDPNFGDFLKAWGGIASLQFGLSLFWTEGRNRGLTIFAINKFMSRATSKIVGLHTTKGRLAVNYDADFVIWEPEAQIKIDVTKIQHKNKITPYLGRELAGKVSKTILRGEVIYDEVGQFGKRQGKLINA